MQRKWTHAPAWVDYSCQLLYSTSHYISRVASTVSCWAGRLLDTYCQCEKCLERRSR